MAGTHFTGPVSSQQVVKLERTYNPIFTGPGLASGDVRWENPNTVITTAIVDSTATPLATLTVQNQPSSAVFRILLRSAITSSGHIYDSTRVAEYLLTVTRVPGAAAVAVLSAAIGATIATSSGGQTLTTALSLGAVSGAVTAVNTFALQVTNVNASAGTTESQIVIEQINGAVFGPTLN